MPVAYQFCLRGLLVLLLAVGGCERDNPAATTSPATRQTAAGKKPVIVTTIFPIESLVRGLVDDWADVHAILPPGAGEHSVELAPESAALLRQADMLVIVGMDMDNWVEARARELGRKELRIYRFNELVGVASVTTKPAGHFPNEGGDDIRLKAGPNPHIWLDPVLVDRFLAEMAGRFEPMFPDMGESLRTRTKLLRMNIGFLHMEFTDKLAQAPVRQMVTFGDAFDPLAKRYGLEVVAHLTPIDLTPIDLTLEGEATPESLAKAIQEIKSCKLRVVYAGPRFPDGAVRAIREQTQVEVLKLDPLGAPGVEGYDSWMATMKSNLDTLHEGQGKK